MGARMGGCIGYKPSSPRSAVPPNKRPRCTRRSSAGLPPIDPSPMAREDNSKASEKQGTVLCAISCHENDSSRGREAIEFDSLTRRLAQSFNCIVGGKGGKAQ